MIREEEKAPFELNRKTLGSLSTKQTTRKEKFPHVPVHSPHSGLIVRYGPSSDEKHFFFQLAAARLLTRGRGDNVAEGIATIHLNIPHLYMLELQRFDVACFFNSRQRDSVLSGFVFRIDVK